MTKTKPEELQTALDSTVETRAVSEEVQKEVLDVKETQETPVKPDVFELEQELIDIGIKYADLLKNRMTPMNSQQIATVEVLCNLYKTIKN